MEALVAAAVPAMPEEQAETADNGEEVQNGVGQNGLRPLNGYAEPVKPGDMPMSEAAPSDPQSSAEGPQAILELPQGLPGLLGEQVGPKYKRGRGRSFFKEQPKKGAVCQVPGCDRSLHKLRDYYKRYKICPYHLELPCLVVEGQTIRFCQQCGRFQLLTDFEGDRRSCRRKLDKHNERRRKAEAEQKARMMDSGSDSPGSTRGVKVQRVSPYRAGGAASAGGGGGGYAAGPAGGGDLGARLQALASDPLLRDGVAPGLLQTLADPGMAGMDWLAAGSLTNLAVGPGPAGTLPPMPTPAPPPMPPPMPQPVLSPDLMALLPADVQQQVMQQGTGVLNRALLEQLQQLGQAAPPPAPQPPPPQRTFGGLGALASLFGAGLSAAPPPPPPAAAPFSTALPPGAAALLGPSLQQPPPPPPQQQQRPVSPPPMDAASVFLQHVQQHQAAASRPQSVPLLRAEPAAMQPAPPAGSEAALVGGNDRTALLLALARGLSLSPEGLAKALSEGGVSSGLGAQIAAAVGAGGGAPQPAPVTRPQAHLPPAPLTAPLSAAPGQPASLSLQQQASGSMGRGGSAGSGGQAVPMDASHPGITSSPPVSQPLQQQPGSVFKPVAPLASAGSGILPAGAPPGLAARYPLDLEQLHSAVQSNGLSAGFAADANLLLQLVDAVEAAQREAGASKERMRSLSLKLFNCAPDRLPKNILEQLESWMMQNKGLLEGAPRPGCVHLAVSALMSGAEFEALSESFSGMVQRLASGSLGGVETSILAQVDGRAALLDERKEQLLQLDLEASAGAVPELCSVRPLAATPAYRGPIMVTGRNIGGPQDTLFCRNGDSFPTTEVLGRGVLLRCPDAGDKHWAMLRIPTLEEGCLRLEAQRGIFVSPQHSLLVLDDDAAVAELRTLEAADCAAPEAAELLHRLGAVLRFGRTLRGANGGGADAELVARVARVAQELAATCLLRRWGAVLRCVLPLACAGCTAEAAVAGIEEHLAGMPLLHAAALTGSPAVVRALGEWAAHVGHALSLDASWGGGLTALHVATLLREPEGVALALTEMFPASAPAVWAAAAAHHGQETPLSLACRLDKRGLLRALALHGVPAAGSMLAALQLQDEAAVATARRHAAAAAPLPSGVTDAAEELALQRRQWTRLYGSKLPEEAAAGSAWPGAGGKPGASGAGTAALAGGAGRQGHESPSSVLGLQPAVTVLQRKGSEASVDLAELAADVAAAAGASQLPAKGRRGLFTCDQAPTHCSCRSGPCKCMADCAGAVEPACKPGVERGPARWRAWGFLTADLLLCALVAVLCCGVLSASPIVVRQHMHLWLLAAVARAPLMLQPLLLLCHPARRVYLRCRDGGLAALHIAMFGLQFWSVNSRAADWLAGSPVLLSYPAGLWLLVAIFILQMRVALQMPALFMMHVGSALLLPGPCKHDASGGSAVPACVAASGARMFAVLVVLPLLAAWLLDARSRSVLVHGDRGGQRAAC